MKRDINFIKHMKPQLKEKERVDKAESRQRQIDVVCRNSNIPQPSISIEDIGFVAAIIKRLKQEHP